MNTGKDDERSQPPVMLIPIHWYTFTRIYLFTCLYIRIYVTRVSNKKPSCR